MADVVVGRVSLEVKKVGKMDKNSKVQMTWIFSLPQQPPPHVVVLTASMKSGKREVSFDGRSGQALVSERTAEENTLVWAALGHAFGIKEVLGLPPKAEPVDRFLLVVDGVVFEARGGDALGDPALVARIAPPPVAVASPPRESDLDRALRLSMSPPSSPVAVASPCFDVATVHGSRGGVATVTLPPSIDASGGVCTVTVPDGWRGGQIAVTALGRRFHTDVPAGCGPGHRFLVALPVPRERPTSGPAASGYAPPAPPSTPPVAAPPAPPWGGADAVLTAYAEAASIAEASATGGHLDPAQMQLLPWALHVVELVGPQAAGLAAGRRPSEAFEAAWARLAARRADEAPADVGADVETADAFRLKRANLEAAAAGGALARALGALTSKVSDARLRSLGRLAPLADAVGDGPLGLAYFEIRAARRAKARLDLDATSLRGCSAAAACAVAIADLLDLEDEERACAESRAVAASVAAVEAATRAQAARGAVAASAAAAAARAAPVSAREPPTLRNVIMALSSQFDYLAEPLDRIMRLTDDAEQGAITGLAASPELGAQ